MLRVLLIILSVVAVILAYALGQPLLYIVALGLVAGAAALTTSTMKKRHADVPESFMQAPEAIEEDLDSLGIVEIRPKSQSTVSAAAKPIEASATESVKPKGQQVLEFASSDDDAAESSPVPAAVSTRPGKSNVAPTRREDDGTEIVGEVRPKKRRARIMVSESDPEQDADVILPAFRSLRSGLDAYTVCLLSQEDAPLRYHVEAVISQNSYARGQGSFAVTEPFMAGERPLEPVVYSTVGADGISTRKLGYYHEPIAVRQVGLVLIKPSGLEKSYLLVVDTMHDRGLESNSAKELLCQYARLLQTVLETAARGDLEDKHRGKRLTSRREIIADEMQKARKESQPLALAMVCLNRGEEIAKTGDSDVSETEHAFAVRLKEVVDTERVEKFGVLTYGVFYRGNTADIASWASHLRASFVDAEGDLRGGVSVGVAPMNTQHESPDDLRSHATSALHKAFKTGECIIVE